MVRVRSTHPSLRAVIAGSARSRRSKCGRPSRNGNAPRRRARSTPGRSQGKPGSHTPTSSCRSPPRETSTFRLAVGGTRQRFPCPEVVLNDGVGHREELPGLLVDFLSLLRAASVDGLPVLYGRGRVSVPAISTLPSPCVDILSPTKQASKKRDSLSGVLLLIHGGASRRFWLEADSPARVAESECCERQKAPQASILFAETNILLLWGSNGRESEPFSVIPVYRSVRCASPPSRYSCTPRKQRGDISREPTLFRQRLKRDLPIRWRRKQAR